MQEEELIGRIKELRQIKPNQDWVVLTKNRILGGEKLTGEGRFLHFPNFFGMFARPKMALAALILLAIAAGAVTIVNYSLEPKIAQQDAKEAREELTQLQEQVLVLQKTIDETIEETAKKIAEVDLETTDPEDFKKIVLQARRVIKEAEEIESSFAVLGVKIDVEDLETATDELTDKALAKVEIEERIEVWENMAASGALSQEEEELLEEIKELMGQKKYLEAWELFLTNQE